MTALDRKLLRDLVHMRGQVAAIAVVVACGVAIMVTNRTAYDSLVRSRAEYYGTYRFADVFARLKRAPEAAAADLARIPGVGNVHTRLVFEATLDVPGLPEPATGRLVSIPSRRQPILNDVHIRRGRWIEPESRSEVLVSEAFAQANRLEVGDTLGAILNGRWQDLRIAGIALSPEYVYEIRGADVFPDNRRFGVMWMSREAMEAAFDMDGAFNDVSLSLAPEASEAEVIAATDRRLERYGGLGSYGRSDQISARFLADEIAQNRVSGTVLPAIFLGVAAFLLNIVLSRLVTMQRDQIAVLKAFGYTHRAVALHYLRFALAAVIGGGALGTLVGWRLGYFVNRMYVEFYRFPILHYEAGFGVVLLATGVSAAAALVGALGAVRRALALPPAEAMRPEPPASFHAGALERTRLRSLLPAPARMIVRGIARRPVRACLSTLSISLAVAILVVGRYFMDAVQLLADVQFRMVQREDVSVTFNEPRSARARHAVARLPGVISAEPFRVVPARLRFAHRSRRTALVGLSYGNGFRRLIDKNFSSVPVPQAGVLLTTKLAEVLEIRSGDLLAVEVLEGQRPMLQVPVAGFVDELIGMTAYMDRAALNRLMREGETVSGAWMAVDSRAAPELYATLKRTPAVAGVTIREAALASFEATLAKSLGIFTTVLIAFACVIAVAMVYNAARISLSERARELASLRVLGFTRGEIGVMLLGEQALFTAAAVPAGYLVGFWACILIAGAYQWELFRLPMVITARTYAFALLVTLGAAGFSGLLVWRRLSRMDLISVIKTRE